LDLRLLWVIWLSQEIRSEDPGKGKLLISFIRGRIIYGRWAGKRIRLPHGSLSSTRRQTLRSMVKVHSVVILVPSQKPHQEAPKKDPHNLRTSLRKKK